MRNVVHVPALAVIFAAIVFLAGPVYRTIRILVAGVY
jgi:hypothetical protein